MPLALVADDEPHVLELVKVTLELDGLEVVTATNGVEALALLEQEYPDVVVLDVMMPEMDGWETLARIKAMPGDLGTTPVLMLTARTADLDRVRGAIEGAIRYLTKPFAPDELRQEVHDALEGEPEPVKRRAAQQQALEFLARLEKGDVTSAPATSRPHLTRLERVHRPETPAPRPSVREDLVATLSAKQLELIAMVGDTETVTEAAERLEVSRSNVYASLRRIARKLDVRSVEDLIKMARDGAIAGPAS